MKALLITLIIFFAAKFGAFTPVTDALNSSAIERFTAQLEQACFEREQVVVKTLNGVDLWHGDKALPLAEQHISKLVVKLYKLGERMDCKAFAGVG